MTELLRTLARGSAAACRLMLSRAPISRSTAVRGKLDLPRAPAARSAVTWSGPAPVCVTLGLVVDVDFVVFEPLLSTTERRESWLFVGGWGEHVEGRVPGAIGRRRLDVIEHRRLEPEPDEQLT